MQVYQGSWIKNRDSRNVVKLFIHESYNPVSEVIIGDISILKVCALLFYTILPTIIKIHLYLILAFNVLRDFTQFNCLPHIYSYIFIVTI